jgi:hypothetical protein
MKSYCDSFVKECQEMQAEVDFSVKLTGIEFQ